MFKRWADGLLSQQLSDARLFRPEEQAIPRLSKIHEEMADYFQEMSEERKCVLHDDMMSTLLQASADGRRLSMEETIKFCKLLLIAGHVTTTNLLSQAIRSQYSSEKR